MQCNGSRHAPTAILDDVVAYCGLGVSRGSGCAGEDVSKDVTPEYLLSLESALRTKDRTRPGRSLSIGHSNGVSVPQLAPLS